MYYNSHKLTGKQVPPLPPTFNQTLSSGLFLALLQWSSPRSTPLQHWGSHISFQGQIIWKLLNSCLLRLFSCF